MRPSHILLEVLLYSQVTAEQKSLTYVGSTTRIFCATLPYLDTYETLSPIFPT